MARQKRIQIPWLIRHVMARGNGRMSIFLDDVDYRQFVYLLGDVVEDHDIECMNYCAMPNHYHATLRPTRPNLSEALRRLNSRYAQWWNKRHERVGHVFQGRFKDQIVQQEGYLLALCRYVAMNPVRAGLVKRPEDWEWSSYAATTGLRPAPSFVAVESVLSQFGAGDHRQLQAQFAEHVVGRPVDERCVEERIRSNERILGDGVFKLSVRNDCGPEGVEDETSTLLEKPA
jgi:REP element-mobilizing transposase RayT